MAGRPPKPTALHILNGSFDDRRHTDRADVLYPDDAPVQIRGLGKDGIQAWHLITDSTPAEILKRIDSMQLFGLCRWWTIWREYDRKHAAGDERALTPARNAWEPFSKLAQQFGMSPTARCRIMAENATKRSTNDELRDKYLA